MVKAGIQPSQYSTRGLISQETRRFPYGNPTINLRSKKNKKSGALSVILTGSGSYIASSPSEEQLHLSHMNIPSPRKISHLEY
jgi:hypothetical protein